MALLDDRGGDVGSDVGLGAPGSEPLADPGVHAVDRRTSRAQLGELGRVLAHAQLAQHRTGELLVGGPGITQPQQVQGRRHVGHRDPAARHASERQRVGVLAVDPRAHLDAEVAERHVAEPGVLERGRDEDGSDRGVARHDERREPLEGRPAMPVR